MSYKLSFTAQELEALYAKRKYDLAQDVSVSSDSFINATVDFAIADGSQIKFRSPADFSQVAGLRVNYKLGEDTSFMDFTFVDAHGHNVTNIDHLFAANAVINVVLDTANRRAFVQNADTNAYIEKTFVKSVNGVTPDPETGNVIIETSNIPEHSHSINDVSDLREELNSVTEQITTAIEGIPEATWESLPDKPFGEISTGGDTWIRDASITDKPIAPDSQGYRKISDYAVTVEDLARGLAIQYIHHGTVYEKIYTPDTVSNCIYPQPEGIIYIGIDDNPSGDVTSIIIYPESFDDTAGIYVYYYDDNNCVESLTIPGFGKFPSIKVIDKKYLPELTTTWEKLDNKPFGEYEAESDILEWDGNTEGLYSFEFTSFVNGNTRVNFSYYKVSDEIITLEDLQDGSTITVTDPAGKQYYNVLTGVTSWGGADTAADTLNGYLRIAANDSSVNGHCFDGIRCYSEGAEHPAGIYFVKADDPYYCVTVNSLLAKGSKKFTKTCIKHIDPKYLPEENTGCNSVSWASAGIDYNTLPKDTWVKVSDAVVTAEDVVNVNNDVEIFSWLLIDGENSYVMTNLDWSLAVNPFLLGGDGSNGILAMPITDANGNTYNGVEFRQDGVFFFTGWDFETTALPLSVTVPNFGKFEAFKPIDSRYLPTGLQTETVGITDKLVI